MSRELSDIPEASMSDVCAEVISSASNNCLDDVCEKPSPLVVDLSKNAENKGFFHVENEQHSSEVRIRKLTEKGQSYQNDVKLNSFKMSSFKGTLKKTQLLRGHYNELSKWKQELSEAQVLGNEFVDAYNDILETVQDKELAKVRNIWEQVCGEWSDFERDVRDEIKYLEQTVLESNPVISKGSKRSKTTKSVKSKSSSDNVLSTKVDKYKLLQEEAALKVKLAYVEQEKALEIER